MCIRDRPCSAEEPEAPSISEKPHKPRNEEEVAGDKKKSLVHEMTMKRIEARRKYGVLLSSEGVEDVCDKQNTSIEKCREEVDQFYSLLQGSVRNQLQFDENKEEESAVEEEKEEPGSTTVNIVQNENTVVVVPRESIKPSNSSQLDTSISVSGSDSKIRFKGCLLYTSPSPRDATLSRMPSSA